MVERACADDGLSSKISGLSGLLSISSILSLVLLVFPRPSKGSVWGSTQTHVGAGTRALLGPRASASRRRALRGAAQGGADVVSRFPLLAPEARCGALRTHFGPVHGGDAPPFMGGPMGGQYHLRMRLLNTSALRPRSWIKETADWLGSPPQSCKG